MQIFKTNKLLNNFLDFVSEKYQITSLVLIGDRRDFDTHSIKLTVKVIEGKNRSILEKNEIKVVKDEFIESITFLIDYHLNIRFIDSSKSLNLLYKQCCVINDIKDYCEKFGVKHS